MARVVSIMVAGVQYSGKDRIACISAAMAAGNTWDAVNAAIVPKSRQVKNPTAKDLQGLKNALTALIWAVRNNATIKVTKADEYRRKCLAALDKAESGIFAGKSRQAKLIAVIKAAEAVEISIPNEVRELVK